MYNYEIWFEGNCIREAVEGYEVNSEDEALEYADNEIDDILNEEGYEGEDRDSFEVNIIFVDDEED